MKGSIVLLALLAVATGAGVLAGQVDSVVLSVDLPDRPGTWARVFEEKNCGRCHALGGHGMAVGPDLGRVSFFGDVLDLAGSFWNHAPVMRKKMAALRITRPVLSPNEASDLVAFLTAYRYYDTMIRSRSRRAWPGHGAVGA